MWNSLLAIAAGALVDHLGSWYLFSWFQNALAATGIPFPPGFWAALSIGDWLGMDIVGGFVTGYVARRQKAAHAAVTGTIMAGVAVILIRYYGYTDPWDAFCLTAMVPCETFGGWLASRLKGRRPPPPRGPAPPIASPF